MIGVRCPRCGTIVRVARPDGCYVCTAWPSSRARSAPPGWASAYQEHFAKEGARTLRIFGSLAIVGAVLTFGRASNSALGDWIEHGFTTKVLACAGLVLIGIGAWVIARWKLIPPATSASRTARSVILYAILALVAGGFGVVLLLFLTCAATLSIR